MERVVPLAVHFDDDGALDTWAFANKPKALPAVTLSNVNGYVENAQGGWKSWRKETGGSNNEPAVIREVAGYYSRAPRPTASPPAYIIFVSDGGVAKSKEIRSLLVETAHKRIFWQFVGIGGSNYGILERLDTMPGRVVNNCSFFALDDLHSVNEEDLYDRLLAELPQWLAAAKSACIYP